MSPVILTKIFLPLTFVINFYIAGAQNFKADTSTETSSLYNAISLYHQLLSPETGLYNGSEYKYALYYPFRINEGHPFFISDQFDTGSVFYNDVLYEKLLLLYDIIKGELVTRDPTTIYILRLNMERLNWFMISHHTFIKVKRNTEDNPAFTTGYYEPLYSGNIFLYKKVSKVIEEIITVGNISRQIKDINHYFIKKNNQYYEVKNKRSLMLAVGDKKSEVAQFMKKNKLRLKKIDDDALIKIVAHYDEINSSNKKATN